MHTIHRLLVAVQGRLRREALSETLRFRAPEMNVARGGDERHGDFDPTNSMDLMEAIERTEAELLICDWIGSADDHRMSAALFERFPHLCILCLLPDNRMRVLRQHAIGTTCRASLQEVLRVIRRQLNGRYLPIGFLGAATDSQIRGSTEFAMKGPDS